MDWLVGCLIDAAFDVAIMFDTLYMPTQLCQVGVYCVGTIRGQRRISGGELFWYGPSNSILLRLRCTLMGESGRITTESHCSSKFCGFFLLGQAKMTP